MIIKLPLKGKTKLNSPLFLHHISIIVYHILVESVVKYHNPPALIQIIRHYPIDTSSHGETEKMININRYRS
jgi:hypothetical protein